MNFSKRTFIKWNIFLTSFLLAFFLANPAQATDATTPAPSTISIDNFSFSPATLTVKAGTTVTWVNHDDIPHTVVSADTPRAFKSPPMDTDGSFSFTFSKPGSFSYFCSIHPKMTGKVVVH